MTQIATAPTKPVSATPDPGVLSAVRRRLAPMEQVLNPYSWAATVVVTFLAAIVRLVNLAHPNQEIFDEIYYATDANDLLTHFVEWDDTTGGAGYVVHPPLGKWMIAFGIKVFGYNSFGWRVSATVIGIASVLMITRIAQRMFGSTVLGCAAGLLMAFDGAHFVLSRSALLDIFLMFFILAAFGALLLDRDQKRRRWADFIAAGGDPSSKGRAGRLTFAVPYWRLLAAAMLGCAIGIKWSAAFVLPAFLVLVLWWEIGARRTAGVRQPVLDTIIDEIGWLLLAAVIIFGVYLATWAGWFLTDTGYYRHWLRDQGRTELPVLGALRNLYEYHSAAFGFHSQLDDHHKYMSKPWQWLLLGRPVAFYFVSDLPCGAAGCAAEIVLLGTPLLWWSSIPALGAAIWFGIARRDWRAGAILVMVAATYLPWFLFPSRTMFYFYAIPIEPFLILAVVYVLGAIMTVPKGSPPNESRQLMGAVLAGAFVLLVVLNFVYFYPIYAGQSIPTTEWNKRMWLGDLWI